MFDKPNYEDYSISELLDVEQNIDQELYPDRFFLITQELQKRLPKREKEKQYLEDNTIEDNKLFEVPTKKTRITWIIISLLLGFWWLIERSITGKNRSQISAVDDPIFYWSFIIFIFGNAIYNLIKVLNSDSNSE